jgi:hypothetical protein
MSEVVIARQPTELRALRSTVVVSGIAVFRARGIFDAYSANLAPEMRDMILTTVAGTWLHSRFALAHFAAVDAIGLTNDEAFDVGATSARRFGQTLWGAVIRMARGAGVDPWTVLGMYDRLWSRSFDGGGFVVTRVGPKEASIDISSMPFARHAYFRNALRGTHHALLSLFAQTLYVREVPRKTHEEGFRMRISWV